MIFADKLIALRKKSGWSQEELAAQLGVTRQSVSKWEGAQSVPDIDKILQLSRLFGVSTDYLLKDDMGEPEYVAPAAGEDNEPPMRRVTMEEASVYIARCRKDAPKMALAVFLCVISPVCLLLLIAMSEDARFAVSENAAIGIGVTVILLLVAAAVAIFVACAARVKDFDFLENSAFETEYGVSGMVRERRNDFRDAYNRLIIIAAALCILSPVPIIIAGSADASDFICIAAVCVLLLLVGVGAALFTLGGTYQDAMNRLLEESDYTRGEKAKKGVKGTVSVIYWLTVTAIYLAYAFSAPGSSQPKNAWVIWAVGGVLYVAVMSVTDLILRRKK